MDPIKYKNYVATLEIDITEGIIIGRVHGLKDRISFHTSDASKIEEEFHTAVEDYLAFCNDIGEEPEKPFSGSILIRTTPEIHRQVAMAAIESDERQGKWIESAITEKLNQENRCGECKKEADSSLSHFVKVWIRESARREPEYWPKQSIHHYGVYKND